MCGLWGGMSSFLAPTEVDRIKMLAILSVFRGDASSGVAVVKKRKKGQRHYNIHKAVENSASFVLDGCPDSLFKESIAIIGHSRQPTIGETNLENAHPHQFDHIIGTHNGTIPVFSYTDADKKMGSDSRVLFKKIAEDGLVPALKSVGLRGAYAIAYMDKKKGTLNFVRNKERPLYFMYSKGAGTLYWASEKLFLQFVRQRCGEGSFEEPWLLKERTLLSFEIGNLRKNRTEEDLDVQVNPPRETIRSFPHTPGPRSCVRYGHNNNFAKKWTEPKNPIPIIRPKGAKKRDGKNISYQFMYIGHEGLPIPMTEANAILASTCSYCTQTRDTSDVVWWLSDIEFICDKCATSDAFAKHYMKSHSKHRGELVKVPIEDVGTFLEMARGEA